MIRLMIGLGNPGAQYKNTYHNAGHVFIEFALQSAQSDALAEVTMLASDSFMNESGTFVAREVRKRGVKPEELLIIHDDSDLFLGTAKLAFGRGAAGHHGIESIISALGTEDFHRLRIGIRPREEETRQKAGDFVLKKITPEANTLLRASFEETLPLILKL